MSQFLSYFISLVLREKRILLLLLIVALINGCDANSKSYFEFYDSGCTDTENLEHLAKAAWVDGYLVAKVKSNLNCAVFAQKPSYQMVDNEVIFNYETMSSENEAIATCECTHEIVFKLRTDKNFPVKVYANGKQLNVEQEQKK